MLPLLPFLDLAQRALEVGVQSDLVGALPFQRPLNGGQQHLVEGPALAEVARGDQVATVAAPVADVTRAGRIALRPVVEEVDHFQVGRLQGEVVGQHEAEVGFPGAEAAGKHEDLFLVLLAGKLRTGKVKECLTMGADRDVTCHVLAVLIRVIVVSEQSDLLTVGGVEI